MDEVVPEAPVETAPVEPPVAPAIDARQFRRALGSFATGVTLATTASQGDWHGITANAVMSVSLDPPLVLLSVQQGTRMHAALRYADNFALSILRAEQADLARFFADSSQPHGRSSFSLFPHHQGRTGAPLLDDALAHVECQIVDAHPAGDHTLFIGRVVALDIREGGTPLLYFRGLFS